LKKFTIIATPEHEHQILGELSKARVVQLKAVSGVDINRIRKTGERVVDYKGIYEKLHEEYQILEKASLFDLESTYLATEKIKEFTEDPNGQVDIYISVFKEIQDKIKAAEDKHEEREKLLLETKARLESLRALNPDELKSCLTVGLVDLQIQKRLEEYLKRFEDINYKLIEVSQGKGYIFVFGPEQRREWVETIFLIFEVEDIYEVLNTRDILLAIDSGRRDEVIKEYEEEVERLQELAAGEVEFTALKTEYAPKLVEAKLLENMLRILSDESAPVLRTNVISVIQGWIANDNMQVLDQIIHNLQDETGELFYLQYEDPGHEDHGIPSPEPVMKPSFLQPAWKLTSLRGWPSITEVNPMYISVLVFSFQFGLMYGDIGQGALFLIAGIFMSRKYKRGMMSKLGTLFIPMGIFAIIFGIGYDSIFLMEGLLFHHHQFMPNPVHETTTLMKWIFKIAAVEIIFGLVLGAINQWREGHKWGVLGEHGLGMILYVLGLTLSVFEFIRTGDFMGTLGYWGFFVMLGGMFLAMAEPIIAAIAGKHFGIEVIGEGVGALLMTFVEGLANLFSFLRIVAFALAHASLAGAAHQLSGFMGTIPSLILMNLIAMSFEFMSSGVQSLRLLYYEFMGKFYSGEGVPFRPYRLRVQKTKST
jgi:vacuolar-type H+-ATPase subunit I/STV1